MKKTTISLIILTMLSLPFFDFATIGRAQECPNIQDLTFNVSAVGSPSKPRPINDYGYESNPFEYNEENYYTYRKQMHNADIIVAYGKDIPNLDAATKSNFSKYVYNVWNYYWNIFQGFPFDKYTILFHTGPFLNPGARGLGYETAYPFTYCCSPYCGNYVAHAHEIFHAWDSGGDGGINPKENSREKWFIEGGTIYYEHRSYPIFMENVRGLQEVESDFASAFKNWALGYYLENIKGTEDDISLIEMGYQWANTEKGLYYTVKGALVAYLLDEKLHEDGSNLDALMKYMYQAFDCGLKHYRSEDIRDACEALTGKDYNQFFDSYVFGSIPLPLDYNTKFKFYINSTPPFLFEGSDPILEITANKSDETVSITTGEQINIRLALKTGGFDARYADWWVLELAPSGDINYLAPSTGSMVPGLLATYRGPLFDFGSTKLLSFSDLTVGSHIFCFGVDLNMNGSLDADSLYYDCVTVSLTEQ